MSFRDDYFAALKIDSKLEKEKVKLALDRAYKQRSFEIEHYWKRGTYFWGYQIVAFATFGLVWKDSGASSGRLMLVALAIIGLLTAIANFLSSEGSKFWQQNWENHIDMLEDEIEGRLYKTVWLDHGNVSFSVSQVNRSLNLCFAGFWLFVLGYVSCRLFAPSLLDQFQQVRLEWILVPFVLSVIGISVLWRRTVVRGHLTDIGGPKAGVWGSSRRFEASAIVVRLPPNDDGRVTEKDRA